MLTPFTEKTIMIIKNIPKGKVATYGQIAAMAGNHRAARQVARILHSLSKKHSLPWHRVIGKSGRISLKKGYGYEVQKELLKKEGIIFNPHSQIDLSKYQWDINITLN